MPPQLCRFNEPYAIAYMILTAFAAAEIPLRSTAALMFRLHFFTRLRRRFQRRFSLIFATIVTATSLYASLAVLP